MSRQMNKYKSLFNQYDLLDLQQEKLYNGQISLPADKKSEYNELQVKKIAILEEMEKSI